jgi:hypothetical protein
MTREAHLVFCKKCTKREINSKVGLVCSITGEIANFEGECKSYELDQEVIALKDAEKAVDQYALLGKLSVEELSKFQSEQDYSKAVLFGLLVGIAGAILWATITVVTNFQIGYMAIAVGAAVGVSMRFMGKGIDQIFGLTGGLIALLSCLLGNFLSIIGFIANAEGLGYFETLLLFDYNFLLPIMQEAFSPLDILFYGIAAYEAYNISFRSFTEKELNDLVEK